MSDLGAFMTSHLVLCVCVRLYVWRQQDQMIDDIMRGLISTPMENLDNHITGEVTKHLFEETGRPFSGLDLVSLNIQRGG